jgi:hypothetical protein
MASLDHFILLKVNTGTYISSDDSKPKRLLIFLQAIFEKKKIKVNPL